MSFRAARPVTLLALLLAACLAAGCNQTEQANKLVDEMNALTTRGEEVAKQAIARSQEMQEKDFEEEREEVRRLARESADLFRQARDQFREAADKAEQAGKLKVDDWYKNYLSLKAQEIRKRAEVFDLSSREGDIAAGDATLEEINEKITELEVRAEKLNEEGAALTAEVRRVEAEHKEDFRGEGGAK